MFQVPYKFSDQVAKITQRDIKNNKSLDIEERITIIKRHKRNSIKYVSSAIEIQ